MGLVLAFGATLLVGVLISERAHRSVLSTTVLFLVVGFLLGSGVLGWLPLEADQPIVGRFAELALFSVLFTDGSRMPLSRLREAWALPGRALLLGLPLTMGAIALAAHTLAGLTWVGSFLIGAILSPTDPVFASAILEHEAVPRRVRDLLGVESGLNDGLALPVVMGLLSVASRQEAHLGLESFRALIGVGLGLALPWIYLRLEGSRFFAAAEPYRPLGILSVGLVLLGLEGVLRYNAFLAAFAAGMSIASLGPAMARDFEQLGGHLAELAKLAAVLIFGATLTPALLAGLGLRGLLFVAVVLLLARPAALLLALGGHSLDRREWVATAWFGPKGFASLLYGLLALHAHIEQGAWLFTLVAGVVTASIIAHSSTDVVIARTFYKGGDRGRRTTPSG